MVCIVTTSYDHSNLSKEEIYNFLVSTIKKYDNSLKYEVQKEILNKNMIDNLKVDNSLEKLIFYSVWNNQLDYDNYIKKIENNQDIKNTFLDLEKNNINRTINIQTMTDDEYNMFIKNSKDEELY